MVDFSKFNKKIFATPVISRVFMASKKVSETIANQPPIKEVKQFWRMMGPGLTTGAADDDPSGIATYSQAGAQYGLSFLWLASWTFPLMAVIQEMCARIGMVTGQGLAANIRKYYSRQVLYVCTILLFISNTFNIGADLGAMAKGVELIFPQAGFFWLTISFVIVSLLLQIFTTYEKYAQYLKWLALLLLSYIFSVLFLKLDWLAVLYAGFVPRFTFSWNQMFLICAVLGTTISPYLFFWQTSQEVEEEILAGRTTINERRNGANNEDIKKMRIDIWSGMFLSNLVMFFIIVASTATIYASGLGHIETSADAALALRPLAGSWAYFLFALGIIGTGMLAVPVLAGSASYAISESFGWKFGLYRKLKEAAAFYGVIIVSMIAGLLLNFVGIDPIKALIYSAVLNGLISPVILVLIVRMGSNAEIMGDRVNHFSATVLGWFIVALMSVSGVAAVLSMFF